jgi:hypothetical protein
LRGPLGRSPTRLTGGHVALRSDERTASALRSHLLRVQTGASTASRCWRARSVHLGGRWGASSGCDGDRFWPGRPPRTEFVAVGDAHEVVVPPWPECSGSRTGFRTRLGGGPSCPWNTSGRGTRCESPSRGLEGADLQRATPYLACQLSVRKVVPTLTSNGR